MREIKFRLYCSNNKEWERGEWLVTNNGMLVENKFGRNIPISNKTHLLSQYTGIKDKNGKEIYEGDIVKAYINYSDYCLIGEVKYGKFTYSACDEYFCERHGYYINTKWEDYQSNTGYPIQDSNILEVIGNIYENEDLLEK